MCHERQCGYGDDAPKPTSDVQNWNARGARSVSGLTFIFAAELRGSWSLRAYDDSDELYRQHTRDIRDSVRLFRHPSRCFVSSDFFPLAIWKPVRFWLIQRFARSSDTENGMSS
jgi:hypothetical protein